MAYIPNMIQIHLNEIAERLSQGKAAVMVGAGFSKNAVKIKNTDKKFLSWNELGDLFYVKLNGKKPDAETGHYLDALRLAGNIESTFGRPALDRILIDNLPDEEYEPSDLHKELLKLNWADVFTTNYDTLLERTRKFVANRKYQVVANKDDLVYSQCPRIIKLHGSFPSERPFVISQEDYRKYPKDSAAFVNTVQQALLENVMCLVGFSGDDPNFLNWLGWIRDNLGKHMSKIYFISVDLVPRIDNTLLESRNIVVLNMAECFRENEMPNIQTLYKNALELFIREIQGRQKARDKKWLPEEQTYGQIRERVEKQKDEDKKRDMLKDLYERWKDSKQHYPGWIVMPYKFRCKFRDSLENFESCLFAYRNTAAKNDYNEFLKFIKVYDWVRQVCLMPLTGKMFELYNEALDHVSAGDCSFLEIKLSLLEYYRQNGMFQEHLQMMNALKKCPFVPDEQRVRIDCEDAYAALYRFDFETLKRMLGKPADSLNYDMELSNVGLLWECNRHEQGRIRLVNALDRIRCIESSGLNMKALSQEAYIINLFGIMTRMDSGAMENAQENDEFVMKATKTFSEYESQCYGVGNRCDLLKLYDCDPESEMEMFQNALWQQTYACADEQADYERSVQFINFLERVGMCMQIDTWNAYRAQLRTAIKNIGKRNLYWGIVLSVRTREARLIRSVLENGVAAACSGQEADRIAERALEWIKNYYSRVNGGTEASELPHKFMVWGVYMPQVLSTMVWYVSAQTRRKIFEQLLEITGRKGDFSELGVLVRETLSSFGSLDMKEKMAEILKLFADSDKEELLYCIMGCDLAFYEKPGLSIPDKNEILKKLEFLRSSNEGNLKAYVGIMYRMAILCYMGALSPTETQNFKEYLLANLKSEVFFPLEMYFYIHNLVPAEEKFRAPIQRSIAAQLKEAAGSMHETTEYYRFVRKFELVCETYGFVWNLDAVESIVKILELLKAENSDGGIKVSYFYQIFLSVICHADIRAEDRAVIREGRMGVYGEELAGVEKKHESIIAGISGDDAAAFMDAAGFFYKELRDDFAAWKDCADQVVLILCMTAKRELSRAVFCVDMIRKILKLSEELRQQIKPGKIAGLLKYSMELPAGSYEALLLKAGCAKLAYDLSRWGIKTGELSEAVTQWKNMCRREDTAAIIRKQWYDIT